VSGTNAHVIVEEPPAALAPAKAEAPAEPARPAPLRVPAPWVLSARSESALRAQAERLAAYAKQQPEAHPIDVGQALVATRSAFEHRAVVVGESRDELLQGLTALARDESPAGLVRGTATATGPTALVFPGQGTQWAGMGAGLLDESPVFKARIEECAAALAPFVDFDVVE
ncbi:CurL C-terminal domain-containing protein, partial [Streptomyces sp. NRAIS3]